MPVKEYLSVNNTNMVAKLKVFMWQTFYTYLPKQICVTNKKYTSDHRCERKIMAPKCNKNCDYHLISMPAQTRNI